MHRFFLSILFFVFQVSFAEVDVGVTVEGAVGSLQSLNSSVLQMVETFNNNVIDVNFDVANVPANQELQPIDGVQGAPGVIFSVDVASNGSMTGFTSAASVSTSAAATSSESTPAAATSSTVASTLTPAAAKSSTVASTSTPAAATSNPAAATSSTVASASTSAAATSSTVASAVSTTATNCLPGFFASSSSCLVCPWGFWCDGIIAQACNAGTASAVFGASSPETCAQCLEGMYSPSAGTTACRPCPAGFYCPSSSVSIACPANTVSPQGSISAMDCACLSGYECTYGRRLTFTVSLLAAATLQQLSSDTRLASALRQAVEAKLSMTKPVVVRFGGFSLN